MPLLRSLRELRRAQWIATALAGVLVITACGKKGPPLPPERTVPQATSALRAHQVGDRVLLALSAPSHRTDGTPLPPTASLDIHLSLKTPPPESPRAVLSQPAATWSIPADQWDRYRRGERLEIPLPLDRIMTALPAREPGWTIEGKQLSFVAEVVDEKRHSVPSPVATLAACAAPRPPSGPVVRVVPDGARIEWAAEAGASGTVNVYRREAGGPLPAEPTGRTGASETSFHDASIPPRRPVEYVLRRQLNPGCESVDSDHLAVTWVDVFPPAAPQGLAAVEEEGVIRLFWRPNQEPDLRGYRVYRSTQREGEEPSWVALNQDALVTTSFTDEQVQPGIPYLYVVTAVDDTEPANESPRSEPARAILEPAS